MSDAILRSISIIGVGLEEIKTGLKIHAERERKGRSMKITIDHISPEEVVNPITLQMIPCITRIKVRVGINLFTLNPRDIISNNKGR